MKFVWITVLVVAAVFAVSACSKTTVRNSRHHGSIVDSSTLIG